MGFFNKQRTDGRTYDGQGEERKGFIDRISFNGEAEDIVWKFPYDNLSIGTQLIVNHSQEAIFLRGGAVCDIFGEGTHTLSTNNIPVLQKLINLPFGGRTPFTAEVYFVSKTVRRNLKFGTINAVPVINFEASLNKNAIAFAISTGEPMPKYCMESSSLSNSPFPYSSRISSAISVFIQLGNIAFTLMP